MTTSNPPPPWLANYKPDLSLSPTKWKPGMKSPNAAGRPKGIVDRRSKIAQAFLDDAHDIAKAVVTKALAGDLQAASLVLSRVLPVLKARAEKVVFTLDTSASLTNQARSVLEAVAGGELDPENGKLLIDAISTFGGLREVDELRTRLDYLEARSVPSIARGDRGGVLAVESSEGKIL